MSTFLDLINKQRAEKKEEKFEGTFLEYLEQLQKDSDIAKPAHKRLYDAIK
jgi:serine protein kinase